MTTVDWSTHWQLDGQVDFLNHGSFGAAPTRVLNRQQELREQLENQPIQFMDQQLMPLLDRARGELAAFIGADPDGLGFVSNATTGVNAVLRSRRFDPGDEILVFEQSYPACVNAAEFVARRDDASVRRAELPFPCEDADELVDAVVDALTPKVELAIVDHIFSQTGVVAPVERITEALQQRHVDVMIDGAHAPGMLDLDVAAIEPEYYAGNCHKWLCAPKGAGFVWVDEHHRDEVHPTTISNGYSDPPPGRSQFHAEFDWQGTMDPTPWLCVPTAIEFLGSLLPEGWDGLRERNHRLAVEARDILCDAVGAGPLVPEEMMGSMAVAPLPDEVFTADGESNDGEGAELGPRELEREFAMEHGIVPAVKSFGDPPTRLLRVSCQLYNHREQYERLGELLSR